MSPRSCNGCNRSRRYVAAAKAPCLWRRSKQARLLHNSDGNIIPITAAISPHDIWNRLLPKSSCGWYFQHRENHEAEAGLNDSLQPSRSYF